jgi:hypothetical protein
MKKLFLTAFCGLGALGGLCLAPQAAAQTTIYADNFTGSSSDPLDGTTPGTESGTLGGSSSVAWSAKSDFNADGSIGNGYNSDGSAALPFVPQAGEIYTLSPAPHRPPDDPAAAALDELHQLLDLRRPQSVFRISSTACFTFIFDR